LRQLTAGTLCASEKQVVALAAAPALPSLLREIF
jgi:hypothetical protein